MPLKLDLKRDFDPVAMRAELRRRNAGVQARAAFGMALVVTAMMLIGASLMMLALG